MIGEFSKMWLQDEYQGYEGKCWSLPPRKVLPKPYGKPHPAMWYAAGNTSSYRWPPARAWACSASRSGPSMSSDPCSTAYKEEIGNAEPVGRIRQRQHHGHHRRPSWPRTTRRRRVGDSTRTLTYLQSNVFRYHDTFPHPENVPLWPELIPDVTVEAARPARRRGAIIGDPDDALEQCKRWESAGADQLVFGVGMAPKEESLEMIRLMGEHVIPKMDTDPVHRTTRQRAGGRQVGPASRALRREGRGSGIDRDERQAVMEPGLCRERPGPVGAKLRRWIWLSC